MKAALNHISKYRLTFFSIILILTVLISRILVSIKDPNIFIKGFELHHFYYGLFILIILSLFTLLKKKINFKLYIILSAISIGLIADELIFISGKIRGAVTYTSTFPSSLIVIWVIILIAFVINYRSKILKMI